MIGSFMMETSTFLPQVAAHKKFDLQNPGGEDRGHCITNLNHAYTLNGKSLKITQITIYVYMI